MSLKRKEFLEGHKKVAGDKLVTRMSFLKEKGLDAVAIKRDSFIKKIEGRHPQSKLPPDLYCCPGEVKR